MLFHVLYLQIYWSKKRDIQPILIIVNGQFRYNPYTIISLDIRM
jgi:hypothetical protein